MDWLAIGILILLGMAAGHLIALRSLLIGVDSPHGRTPTMIGERMVYVVPEDEYCRLKCLEAQEIRRHV